jgi:hypothetical protein
VHLHVSLLAARVRLRPLERREVLGRVPVAREAVGAEAGLVVPAEDGTLGLIRIARGRAGVGGLVLVRPGQLDELPGVLAGRCCGGQHERQKGEREQQFE